MLNTRDFSSREEGEAEIIPPPMVENREGQGRSAEGLPHQQMGERQQRPENATKSPLTSPEPQRGARTCCRNQRHDLRRASVTKRKV